MAIETRKYERRERIQKADEARRSKNTGHSEVLTRALKRVRPRVDVDLVTPRSGVLILTDYLTRLEILRDDLRAEFGNLPEMASAAGWINLEIRLTLEELIKLRIKVEAGGEQPKK